MPGEPNQGHSGESGSAGASAASGRPPRSPGRAAVAAGIGAMLLATSLGVAFFVTSRDGGAETFLEVYVTDLPADVSRLDVQVSSVTVGPDRVPLQLDRSAFDLLQLRGPSGALRIARGMVPSAENQEIHVAFGAARAQIYHQSVALEIPRAVLSLGHDYGLSQGGARSVLFDIDVERSLRLDGPRATFEPFVDSVYVVAQGAIGSGPHDDVSEEEEEAPRADFTAAPSEAPREQRLGTAETRPESGNPFTRWTPPPTTTSPAPSADPTPEPSADNETDPGSDNESGDGMERYLPDAGDSNSAPVDYLGTIAGWLVQFRPDASSPEAVERSVHEAGAELVYRFGSVPAAYVLGTPVDAENLTHDPYVTYVEPVLPTGLHLSSSKTALRIPLLSTGSTAIRDAQGDPIDGRGIGVAVVDTGIDGLHPDLAHRQILGASAPVQFNYKVESVVLVDMIHTDTTSGHGTHVAGIVGGRGTKDPNLKGVAPGATLYGFGIGELSNTFWANQAFDWIVKYGANQNPPIRVVTNSWGTVGSYDPNSLTTRLVNEMVAKGMVVVFSAGNGGGDGSEAMTSRECRIPTPGVVCVAWYDDEDVGSRTGKLAPQSSRGLGADPSTWPDVSAPGSSIRSARTPFGWVTGVGLTDYYVTLQGTSMAAPHAAGTAALMLQAKPTLSPAQVESILKQTAVKYADGGAYDPWGSHVGKGHGLVDAYAAVAQAQAA